MNVDTRCRFCHSAALTVQASFDESQDISFGDIVRCRDCGLYSVEKVPSEEELERFYRQYPGTRGYSQKRDKKIRRASSRIRRLMKKRAAKTFLDVGCNLGYAVEAARRCGLSASGIDLGAESIERARASFPQAEFICGDIATLSAQGRKFDIVYCSEVIEHVPDFFRFSEVLADLVAPQGILFLTTPDASHWRVPRDFVKWEAVTPPEHLTWFSKSHLKGLFEKLGFETAFEFNLKPGIKMIGRRLA